LAQSLINTATMQQVDLDALTNFAIANDDLERLEALANAFNIFEALGVARQELRHSDFLAFLLDPRQPHGLGDRFLKRFLQRALSEFDERPPVTPVEVELLDLNQMVPYRERQNIDILLLDEPNRIAVIVENKIGSGEHSEQLKRYLDNILRQYPSWRVIPIFLSPDGTPPSDERYLQLDYGAVSEIASSLADSRRSNLDPESYGLIQHYVRLLRRYVVEDSEIADLCQRIYSKHQRAIDLIIEHRPGDVEQRKVFLQELIHSSDGLIEADHTRSRIWFLPVAWDRAELRQAVNWKPSNHILQFEFEISPKALSLLLVLGPGDAELRQTLVAAAREAGPPFKLSPNPGPVWARFFSTAVLTEKDMSRLSDEEQQDRIRQFWEEFTSTTLPAMVASLRLPVL
jgi:hypothetical protein